MTYTTWNPNKAAEIGDAKGRTIGYVAGLYSTPGMSNISAASAEVLNQYGYSIYQDDESGRFKVTKDRDIHGGSIWTSDCLGMTFDYTGDSLVMSPVDSDYYNTTFDDRCNEILNRLDASQNSGTKYGDTAGLKGNETIDPITGQVIDKEKSKEIDALGDTKSAQRKFDKIAKLINKVHETQNAPTVTTDGLSTVGGSTLAAAGAGAGIGALFGGPIGAAIGGGIGAVVGLIGGGIMHSSDKSKAQQANNEAAQAAKDAGEELKAALAGLSDEEMIAFERYYYEQTGVKVDDVLEQLEVNDDSSTIAQQTGFDDEYITNLFEDMDESNEILKPENSASSTSKEYSEYEQAKINILEQEAQQLYNLWQNALKGKSVTLDGEEKTAAELSEMYLDKIQELETYKASLG